MVTRQKRYAWAAFALAALLLAPAAGCEFEPRPPAGQLRIPLVILQGPGGATLAFVPVYIGDAGPFPFALDTGASNSLVDKDLATELGLPIIGDPVQVTGIASRPEAKRMGVDRWRAGDVELPATTVVSLNLKGDQMQGLLGSDVLSQFDRVTIDYGRRVLILDPR